jgi:hypothetical protein
MISTEACGSLYRLVFSSVLKVVKAMHGDPPPSNCLGDAKVIIRRAKWWATKRGKDKVGGRMVHAVAACP